MAFGLQTYDDPIRKEDVLDIIQDVSPDDNPLVTMLGTSKAENTYHEWTEDYIPRPTSVTASAEGAQATYDDLSQPERRGNFTEIITETFRVSGTERAVAHYGQTDPLDYHSAKKLRVLKNKMEFAILNETAASGASGVARRMTSISAAITTLATARNSGTSLSEAEFNDMAEDCWKQVGKGKVFDLVLVPAGLKRKISSFTAGSTRYIDASDKRLVNEVMVYESDFGVHRIMAHHDVNNSAGAVHFLGLREDTWKIAYLRPPFREMLAKDGDRDNGQWVTEFTIEYLAERANVKRTGYNQKG